jgi:hypothetical protein
VPSKETGGTKWRADLRSRSRRRQVSYLPLTLLEHRNALAPSTLLTLYTFTLGLFGAAELRTLKAVNFPSEPFVVKAVLVASIFGLLVLETVPKRKWLKAKYSVSLIEILMS